MSAMDTFARDRLAAVEAKLEKYGQMLEEAHEQWSSMQRAAIVGAAPPDVLPIQPPVEGSDLLPAAADVLTAATPVVPLPELA